MVWILGLKEKFSGAAEGLRTPAYTIEVEERWDSWLTSSEPMPRAAPVIR